MNGISMTRDETVALFLQGREAWNAWAETMLAQQETLEKQGRWADMARADFSRCLFLLRGDDLTGEHKTGAAVEGGLKSFLIDGPRINFNRFVFPGEALFRGVTFSGRASFRNATFSGRASFGNATFTKSVGFGNAIFRGDVWFRYAIFKGDASFAGASFSRDATFLDTAFDSPAEFESATFSGGVWFGGAIFLGRTSFGGTIFSGDASFASVAFKSSTIFRDAKFLREATFPGIKVERAFDMTGVAFAEVPAFNQADFKQAPDLDDVLFPLPGPWNTGKAELIAKYRAIRRMAIQGADYEREQMALKGELRSKRWTTDRPWHLVLWLGLFYDCVSDCGRSAARPLLAWCLCIAVFAVYFLGQTPEIMARREAQNRYGFFNQVLAYSQVGWSNIWQKAPVDCLSEDRIKEWNGKKLGVDDKGNGFSGLADLVRAQTNTINEAISIAYHNALVVLDGNGDGAHRAFGCLYGVERYGGNPVAYIPPNVAIASSIQKLLSAIFIFLFGLAVRNMLKVK